MNNLFTVCPLTQTGPGCTQCLPGFTGQDCQICEWGFYDFPSCKGCIRTFIFTQSFSNRNKEKILHIVQVSHMPQI